jgi:tetratricopeptide (TPR) repeat protein
MKTPKHIKDAEDQKDRNEYLAKVEGLLKKGKERDALLILRHALKETPDDPFLLSYYGCLTAIVERKAAHGAKICKDAIDIVKSSGRLGEFIHPVFYLNLGRCYHMGGQRKRAIDAFEQGLRMDSQDPNILQEFKRIGMRNSPLISFLPRSNPLNRYIGLILSRLRS